MFPKIIHFGEEGRSEINKGVNILANAVKSTMGPQGRNVLIGNKGAKMRFTKDGVSVAREVCLYDEIHDAGVNVIREVAINTCNTVGDGTTTATVIAQNIINNGIEFINQGFNPVSMKAGLEKALEKVVKFIESKSKDILTDEEVINIATISANGDRELGVIIAETFKKVGVDGVITLEDSASGKTESMIVEGLQMDRGFITPYFVTNFAKMTCELEDPYILIYDKKISTLQPMLPLLESIVRSNESLLIIAEDVDHEALGTLVLNHKKNNFKMAAIKSPSDGNQRIDLISDLSIMTNSTIVSEDTGIKLDGIRKEMLGRAKKIIITQDKTTIIGGFGEKEKVDARCDYLKAEIVKPENAPIKQQLEERLAKLTNGIAIIKVGGIGEFDIKERKDRVEDAVHATRAALKKGILPGGGMSLLSAARFLNSIEFLDTIDGHGDAKIYDSSFAYGIFLLEKALEAPFNQILENAGKIPEEIREGMDQDNFLYGYDALNFKYVDMIEAGIIDPTEVVLTSLKDAVSIAGMLLTTEVVMIEENEITLNSLQAPNNPYKIRV